MQMDMSILKRLRTQMGIDEALEVTEADVQLARLIALLAQREMAEVFIRACKKHPTAKGVWIAKQIEQKWFNDKDVDDGR